MASATRYKRLPLAGLGLAAAGSFGLALGVGHLSVPALVSALAAVSLGIGTLFPVTTIAVQNAVPPHQLGTTTGVMNFFRQLGGALIVAVLGAIVLGQADAGFETLSAGGASVVGGASAASGGQAADLVGAFRLVFAAAGIGCALSFACLLAMEERPLRDGDDAPGRSG
jgi:hypothetical protein